MTRKPLYSALVTGLTALTVVAAGTPGALADVRDTASACPPEQVVEDGFRDTDGSPFESEIDCVTWWEVAQGTGTGYAPDLPVTRAQMATFMSRLIERAGGTLPGSPGDAFVDDDGSVHEHRINQLAAVGLVGGRGGGRYAPGDPVSRDQMATFLVRTHEFLSDTPLPDGTDAFTDDQDSVHEDNINRAAAGGLTGGTTPSTYSPTRSVTRGQMAAFIARTLDLLVDEGAAVLPGQEVLHLAELEPVAGSPRTGEQHVNGQVLAHSVYERMGGCETNPVLEYDLGRRGERLVVTAGVSDDAKPGTQVQVDVFGDDRRLQTARVAVGEPAPIDVDVRDVLRLRVEFVLLEGDFGLCSDTGNAVLGNAQLIPSDGEPIDIDGAPIVGKPELFLTEGELALGSDFPSTGARAVNGETYARSVYERMGGCTPEVRIDYVLHRAYDRFSAVAGVSDDADAGTVMRFDVIADGREVYTGTAGLGEALPVEVNVSGALRLQLVSVLVEGDFGLCSDTGDAVWGDALVES